MTELTEDQKSLLDKARNNYPKDTLFASAVTGIEAKSSGSMTMNTEGDIISDGRAVYNGTNRQWAVII